MQTVFNLNWNYYFCRNRKRISQLCFSSPKTLKFCNVYSNFVNVRTFIKLLFYTHLEGEQRSVNCTQMGLPRKRKGARSFRFSPFLLVISVRIGHFWAFFLLPYQKLSKCRDISLLFIGTFAPFLLDTLLASKQIYFQWI